MEDRISEEEKKKKEEKFSALLPFFYLTP